MSAPLSTGPSRRASAAVADACPQSPQPPSSRNGVSPIAPPPRSANCHADHLLLRIRLRLGIRLVSPDGAQTFVRTRPVVPQSESERIHVNPALQFRRGQGAGLAPF